MATDTLTSPVIDGGTTKHKVFKNFIDGEWVESASGRTFEDRNPADTREVVAIFQRSNKADVDAAVDAAKRAFAKWRLVPAPRRAEMVFRAAEILIERKEEHARDMTREMGKVLKETRGDVQEAIDAAYYNAGEGRRLFGPTVPSELPNKFAMAVRQPIGVCGMITPWNFPMAISSWKLLPAVVCGNTCVIKPAQDTPLSTFNLVRALTDAGIPKGVINIVTGFGAEVGTPLTEHPVVRAISLTGSSEVGRIVGVTAAKSFKHCSLELGGKNPMIVLDDANLEIAIEGGLWGAFGTTGQRCTATSRIIVQKGVYTEFVDHFVARAKNIKVGNGLDETVEMGPAINENQLKTDLEYIEIGKTEGAKLVCGGNRLDQGDYQHGWFLEPTVFTEVDPKMRIAQEEIFGPVVSIIPCDGLEEAIAIANNTEYGLSSSLYTKDVNTAFAAVRDLEAGITYINAPTIGAEVHLPFGGTKATGNGHREGGVGAIDFYTEWKSVYVDYSDKLQKAQIDRAE
ncbi:MAG TPA: aldehyde dehydrogenase family protein [Terriglobales bacterium]|nr:aldehyde dehydrogenase family protein [Terriglobales bacterium]